MFALCPLFRSLTRHTIPGVTQGWSQVSYVGSVDTMNISHLQQVFWVLSQNLSWIIEYVIFCTLKIALVKMLSVWIDLRVPRLATQDFLEWNCLQVKLWILKIPLRLFQMLMCLRFLARFLNSLNIVLSFSQSDWP